MSVVYHLENVTKIYKKAASKANDDISFDIEEGEIFGLLGPNGAGKSTLINQITGLLRPTSGKISLYGIDLVAQPEAVSDYVALQPQYSGALRDLYPEEALLYTGRLRGLSATDASRETQALMEELGLSKLRKKRLAHLSGGQNQLVNLAVAFIGHRPIMVFDEPTNNLDPAVRHLIWEKLLVLNKNGTTIILVTHNVLEAERVIQRVGIINDGRLLEADTPGHLKARVDQRIRLEILLKEANEEYTAFLQSFTEGRSLTAQHWIILCARSEMQATLNQVIAAIGLEQLDDLRILAPTLEDVYLQLGGDVKLV